MSKNNKQKNAPKILDRVLEFINWWDNPDKIYNKPRPVSMHELWVLSVSPNFVFKWYIEEEDFIEAANYLGEELEPGQKSIFLAIGDLKEYKIELSINEEE